jgi:rfaE bifunctional protein nucleotidyltransferase chain/domain
MGKKKVYRLEDLGKKLRDEKEKGKKIVHCHGCFDLLHHGHIKHFEAAKKYGDILVVTVTEDKHVNKGPDRPYFTHSIRAHNLAALEVVDYVAVNYADKAIPAIQQLKPNYYVKGQDYKNASDDLSGGIVLEKEAVEAEGGRLLFTEEIQFSSSNLLNRFFDDKDEIAREFIASIKKQFDYDHFVNLFDRISKKKVLIIGDIILDEYQFVKPIGKASKSPTITSIKKNVELYAGGVLAVANHVADFVDEVVLVSVYGKNKDQEYLDFIKSKLHENVRFEHIESSSHPTVVKTRYIDPLFKYKLFEVIEINEDPLPEKTQIELNNLITDFIGSYDLTLVADFGHGVLSDRQIRLIEEKANYLALNVQTNSANSGYNLLTKYKRCNYFSIDKGEAHLAVHDKFAQTTSVQGRLNQMIQADLSSITLGVGGTSVMDKDEKYVQAPIFNSDVVDTIGAGDAYLSITSLLAAEGASKEELAFVGNAVGAMAVKIIGNKSYIRRSDLLKYIKTLLA